MGKNLTTHVNAPIAASGFVPAAAANGAFPQRRACQGFGCVLQVETEARLADRAPSATRPFISRHLLRPAGPPTGGGAVRGQWARDVTFGADRPRLNKGRGARNMATVRRFALTLVGTAAGKASLKKRLKLAGWPPHCAKDSPASSAGQIKIAFDGTVILLSLLERLRDFSADRIRFSASRSNCVPSPATARHRRHP